MGRRHETYALVHKQALTARLALNEPQAATGLRPQLKMHLNKRALTQGLLIAVLAALLSQALLAGFAAWKTELIEITPHYLTPLTSELIQASRMLAWIILWDANKVPS